MINIITFLATSLSQNDKGHPVESSMPSSRKEKKKNTWKIQDPGSSSLSPFSPVIVFTSLARSSKSFTFRRWRRVSAVTAIT